MVYPVKH